MEIPLNVAFHRAARARASAATRTVGASEKSDARVNIVFTRLHVACIIRREYIYIYIYIYVCVCVRAYTYMHIDREEYRGSLGAQPARA